MKPNKFIKDRPCIYGIRNTINNKIYIGKTKDPYRRCYQYIYAFNTKRIGDINYYLYNAMSKSGIENFEMFPLEYAPISKLSSLELKWMVSLKSTDRNYGYNIRMDSSTGMIASPETSIKISNNLRSQWASGVRDDHARKMREKWRTSPERRKKQGALFSQIKTKYEYKIHHPDGNVESCGYSRLKEMNLKNVIAQFHRKKSNDVIYKGFRVLRFNKGEK